MNENNERLNELLQRIADGERLAEIELINEYGKLIMSAAASVSPTSVNDVLVTVITKIIVKAAHYSKKKITTNWLYKVSVHQAINFAKKERYFYKTHLPLSEAAETIYSASTEEMVLSDIVFMQMLNKLDEQEKEILIFKFLLNMTFAEIAKELNKPISTISTQYYNATEKIKKELEKQKNKKNL